MLSGFGYFKRKIDSLVGIIKTYTVFSAPKPSCIHRLHSIVCSTHVFNLPIGKTNRDRLFR
jgi:hypothetical protein